MTGKAFLSRCVEIMPHVEFADGGAWLPFRRGRLLIEYNAYDRMTGPGNDDFITSHSALDKLRKVCFRLVIFFVIIMELL